MMAALLRRPSVRWRSRQLTDTLSLPPWNHFTSGTEKSYSSTLSHFLSQVTSSSARRAQKPSGSLMDSA